MHQFCFSIPKRYRWPLKLNISQSLHPVLYYKQIKSQAGLNKMWNRLTKYHVSQCWKRRNWSWKSLKKCYPNITIVSLKDITCNLIFPIQNTIYTLLGTASLAVPPFFYIFSCMVYLTNFVYIKKRLFGKPDSPCSHSHLVIFCQIIFFYNLT